MRYMRKRGTDIETIIQNAKFRRGKLLAFNIQNLHLSLLLEWRD